MLASTALLRARVRECLLLLNKNLWTGLKGRMVVVNVSAGRKGGGGGVELCDGTRISGVRTAPGEVDT